MTFGRPRPWMLFINIGPRHNLSSALDTPVSFCLSHDRVCPQTVSYLHAFFAPRSQMVRELLVSFLSLVRPCVPQTVSYLHTFFAPRSNYGTRQGKKLLPALQMVGDNLPDHAHFHRHLSQLGKTNVTERAQSQLLDHPTEQPVYMENKIFLFEVSQPFVSTEGRDDIYRQDLSDFLGLDTILDPIEKRTSASPNFHYVIDICEPQFKELRFELLEVGIKASEWIREFFMDHPDVTVSSPDHFRELLLSWSDDPCET
jgi:hypothetical protein